MKIGRILKAIVRAAKPMVVAAITTAATEALARKLGKKR